MIKKKHMKTTGILLIVLYNEAIHMVQKSKPNFQLMLLEYQFDIHPSLFAFKGAFYMTTIIFICDCHNYMFFFSLARQCWLVFLGTSWSIMTSQDSNPWIKTAQKFLSSKDIFIVFGNSRQRYEIEKDQLL